MSTLISIVLPIFNEQATIPLIYDELSTVLQKIPSIKYELIFVDDGSSDFSWQRITNLAQHDTHIKAIKLSRNFGHQAALSAGYHYASGDAIISMDADLQDPPQLVPELIKKWQKGFAIVYAKRKERADSFSKRITAHIYYTLLTRISDVTIPRHVGDFRLIDKKVLHIINQCPEKSRYLRGLVAWTGFSHTFVAFDRPNRHAGVTGYSWKKMINLACDGITGFSLLPLRIFAYLGGIMIFSGTVFFSYALINVFIYHVHYHMLTWIALLLYLFMGMQNICLWFFGEYLGRIYEQQKKRPLYIIDTEINMQKSVLYDIDTVKKENINNDKLQTYQ